MGGSLASLLVPKSMFEVFDTLPAEIMSEDSAEEAAPVIEKQEKKVEIDSKPAALIDEEFKAISPSKTPAH